jgi:hypothetical protein
MLEITEPLQKVLNMTDPLEALSVIEDLQGDVYPGGYFKFPADIFNDDFCRVVKQHREKIEFLRNNGLLDKFLGIQNKCEEFVCSDLAPKMMLAQDMAYVLEVFYDPGEYSGAVYTTCPVVGNRHSVLEETTLKPTARSSVAVPK